MTIYRGSRYENLKYRIYNDPERGKIPIMERRTPLELPPNGEVFKHQWKQSDSLDGLANHYLGDPQLWWVILDVNPKYMLPWEIEIGDVLRIPTKKTYRKMREMERKR